MALKNFKKAKQALDKIGNKAYEMLYEVLNENSRLLASHTKEQYLTGGTTATKLKARSGKLRASTKPIRAKKTKTGVKAGIKFGTIYAATHIGKLGTKTTITAKSGGYLKIPLPTVQTKKGVLQSEDAYRATDVYYTTAGIVNETFPRMSKKGNLILFGYKKFQKGAHAGQQKSKLIPLFVLKKQVQIRKRVDPGILIKWIEPKITKDMKQLSKKLKVA